MATANPADYHGLSELGSLGPGPRPTCCASTTRAGCGRSGCGRPGGSWPRTGDRRAGAVPATPAPELDARVGAASSRPPPRADLDLAAPPGGRARTIGIGRRFAHDPHARHRPGRPGVGRGAPRRGRAPPSHRPHRAGLGRTASASSGEPSPPPSATTPTTCMVVGAAGASGPAAMAARAWRRLAELGGGQVVVDAGRPGDGRAGPADRRADERPAGPRGGRGLEDAGRGRRKRSG